MRDILTGIGGVDRCVTEFIRVTDRLNPASVFYKYCPELKTKGRTSSGQLVFVQLLGGQSGPLAENAKFAQELGAPGIDLNFGCPAKTVNRHDGGATLLKNPERLFEIISKVKDSVGDLCPVTAKVRLGFSDKSLVKEIAKAVGDAGASALVVHARTRDEGYRPPAHWEFIALMKEQIDIPLIANGDIWTKEDYLLCREASACLNVALGRGIVARPDLALQIKSMLRGDRFNPLSWQELRRKWIFEFLNQSKQHRGDHFALVRLKQWLKALSRTYPEAEVLFETHIRRAQSLNQLNMDDFSPSFM